MRNNDAEQCIDYDDPAKEVPKENNFSKWPTDCPFGILTKNMTPFFPCQKKNLLEAKLNSFVLMALAENSKQSKIDYVV